MDGDRVPIPLFHVKENYENWGRIDMFASAAKARCGEAECLALCSQAAF